ncbi:DUF4956 domain-containing protein [Lachnospiraceae bacterium ZAX-1]
MDVGTQDAIKNAMMNFGISENKMTLETLIGMLISLAVATLIGFLIYIIYKAAYQGIVYAKSFAMTLVGMTVLTCMVTLAISTNIVLALGMVGALSIVRFRAEVKEPVDLMFLVWAVAAGIATGAKMYLLTCLGSAFVLFLIFVLNAKVIDTKVHILIVQYVEDEDTGDIDGKIRRALKDMNYEIKSKTLRGDAVEVTILVDVRKDNLAFTEKISNFYGVKELTIVQYNGEYHG